MNKNCKSRIPVLVTKQKSSKLCCNEENLQTINNSVKKQTSDANNMTKIHPIQKKTEKIGSQPEKPRNLKDSSKNLAVKNKSAPLKTNIKSNSVSISNKTFGKNVKSDDKNKPITCKANMKPSLTNKSVRKTYNVNVSADKKKILPSAETEIKSNVADDKKENMPSPVYYSFEEEICTPVGNLIASKQDSVSANENVEFEANEIYRKMILSNKELSPNMRKLMPSLRLSSLQSERPSVYQKVEIPSDPLKEALKALENTCLSVQRLKKENNFAQSPRRETFRDSIYTPRGDPNEEFLKKLEDFKLKQLQRTVSKSTKKVTFNLKIQEYTPKNTCDIQHNLLNSENKLVQINEKSEENTPNSPNIVKNNELKTSDISVKHEQNNITDRTVMVNVKDSPIKAGYKDNAYSECNKRKAADQSDITIQSNQKTIEPIIPDKSTCQNNETPLQILKEISSKNSSSVFICDSKNVENYTNCVKDNNIQPSMQRRVKQSAKVYTPKPISLTSKSKMCPDSYSPELLVNKKSVIISDLAPICTPLVLKSQAKNMIFSPEPDDGPIPLKLDFAEEEKDSPKKQTYRNHTLFTLDNIVTFQKQLEDLADQECHLSLINENFPVICGRYLTNPVARTLSEGDDMHFIPIRF